MIYFLRNLNKLEKIVTIDPRMLVYPNSNDLRNYAFLYIYPNGEVDGVIRTANLAEHCYAIQPLLKISPNLTAYKHFIGDSDATHLKFDTCLAKDGILSIYYSTSDYMDNDAFGYINVPAQLTDEQKKFIQSHRVFFEVYEEILINQFSQKQNDLVTLNEFGDGNFLEILDLLSNTPHLNDAALSSQSR